jgi:hypothetical protein
MAVMIGGVVSARAQVAILDSAATKEFMRRHYSGCVAPTFYLPDGEEYQRYFRGWEFVVQEMGFEYQIITDEQLTAEGLAPFDVLILSNIASLDIEATRAVHHWVTSGGKLLATFGTGYTSTIDDPREADRLKRQKGATFGLHQLWHDPMSKAFGSTMVGGAVNVRIGRYGGPTAALDGQLPEDLIPYGALANLLVHRPLQAHNVFAWLRLADGTDSNYPAIVANRAAHGHVVYFSFAPEYIVSKDFALPAVPACDDGQNWMGRSELPRAAMRAALQYLRDLVS